ncbi:MAG: site-2 protease family protein, partial [Thermoplasmataceae archaeon]
MIDWLYIVFLLVIIWVMAIMYLAPRISRSKHFGLLGPALMVKSTKNRNIIDRIAKKFPGVLFGKISVVLVIISSIFAVVLLVYGSILSLNIKPANAPSLSLLIGLPGINPAIPISYGLVTIIVAVAIHEIFHGVVARRQGIKLSSVGALFFIIPLGAFVEPDEKEIMSADPVIRRRIIAAGPGVNIVIAVISLVIVAFLLFPAVTPTHQGLYVESTTGGSVAASLIPTGSELISYGNNSISYSGNALVNLTT